MARKKRRTAMAGIDKTLYTLERIKKNTNKIPEVIFNQYNILYDMYNKGDYTSALHEAKDVLELAIKFPILIMLDIAVEYAIEGDELNKNISGNRDSYKSLEDFLIDALSCEISFGSLERFAKGLAEMDESIAPLKYRDEFLKVQVLLKKIYKLYYNPIGLEGNEYISSWRNRNVGHGALAVDLTKAKEDVEVILKNVHAILRVSDYRDINIVQHGFSYSISALNSNQWLYMSPYVLLNSDFETGNFEYSFLFESINKRGHAKLLDYINNCKKVDEGLSRTLATVSKKLGFKFASENKLDDCCITPEDEEQIMSMENNLLVRVPAFFEETRKLLAKDKGVLFLRSDRGTGKTVFSRIIINNFRKNGGNRYKLELKSKNSNAIFKDLGVEKDDLFVCTYNFNNSWMNDRYIFMTSIEESLEPGNDRRNRDYGRAQGMFKNTFLNEYHDVECDNREYESFRKKLSSEFNNWLRVVIERYKAVYENAKLLIVFDGLDEIPTKEEAVNVADIIDEETLPENVYILCLMRSESEWPMPEKLKALGLPVVEIDKDRFQKVLYDYIQSNVPNISKENVHAIIEKSDKKFIHTQIICEIYKLLCQGHMSRFGKHTIKEKEDKINSFLKEKDNVLIVEYLKIFKQISKKYYNGLMRLLAVLYLAKKPLSLNEMYYLHNGVGDERADFSFYAYLRDLRGFISVSRLDGKNVYSIANEEWKNQLSDDYFKDTIDEVFNNMDAYIKDILPCDECMSDGDIAAVEILIANNKLDLALAEKVLKCIDFALKHNISNFEKNIKIYSELINEISCMFVMYKYERNGNQIVIDDYPELYILTRYLERVIDNYKGVDADEIISGIDEFSRLLSVINTAFSKRSDCSNEIIERLFYIFYVEIVSLYHNGICAKDIIYGYIYEIIDVWLSLHNKKLVTKRFCMLLELFAYMSAIPKIGKDVLVAKLLKNENTIIDCIKSNLHNKYEELAFEVLRIQLDFIDSYSKTNIEVLQNKVEEIQSQLLDLLENVVSSTSYSEQEKKEFVEYVYNFYLPLYHAEKPMNVSWVCAKWYRILLSKKYVTNISYVNALSIAHYYYDFVRSFYHFDNYKVFLQLLQELKLLTSKSFYDCTSNLAFYEYMTKYEMSKSEESCKIDKATLNQYMDEFAVLSSDFIGKNSVIDIYVNIAFYVNTACFAFDCGYFEEVKDCLNMLSSTTDTFNSKSDNSYSFVKYELFYKGFFNLADKLRDNNSLLMVFLECLIKLYKYQNGKYAEILEKCCIKCLECIFNKYDMVNEHTERMLFNRYTGINYSTMEDLGSVPMDVRVKVAPMNYYPFQDDAESYYESEEYIDAHKCLNLDNKGCYLYEARHQICDNLFNFILCLDDEDLKLSYSQWKIRCIRDKNGFLNVTEYEECLKAVQICKDYDAYLTICSKKISNILDIFPKEKSLKSKVDNYLTLAEAYWYRGLCYKAMGEENLHKVDSDKVENIANKLKVSMPDMIKAGFEGSFIKGNYPLINHLYHRIHYVGEKEKEFDLTGYDL